jgi:AcrR family transcriptional regulator
MTMTDNSQLSGQMNEDAVTTAAPPTASCLDGAAWVQAGIKMLIRDSIENVRIDRLAKELGVAERQFYAHFKDQEALHAAILDRWLYKTVVGIIERANSEGTTPQERLRRLLELPFWSSKISQVADFELAIRDWARRSAQTRASVQHADALRLQFVNTLFLSMGFDPPQAEDRAHMAYALVRYLTQNCHLGEAAIRRIVHAGMERLTKK